MNIQNIHLIVLSMFIFGLAAPTMPVHAQTTQETNIWQCIGPPDPLVTGIAPHPIVQNIVYLCTDNRIYKSTNYGQTWNMVSRAVISYGINVYNCIAVDPQNPDYAYATTIYNGMWKTSDGGQTWNHLTVGLIEQFNSFYSLYFVSVSPHDPRNLFAGGPDGLFKSTDMGESWDRFKEAESYGVQFHPTDPHFVYWLNRYEIDRSTDGGEHWQKLPGFPYSLDYLVVHPKDPSVIYAGERTGCWMFKSTDGGQTSRYIGVGYLYDTMRSMNVDASDPNRLFSGTTRYGFAMSTDSGTHWTPLSGNFPSGIPGIIVQHPGDPSRWYVGCGYSMYSPGGKGTGSSYGFQRSDDNGQSWTGSSTGLFGTGECSAFTLSTNPATVYFLADGETILKSKDNGVNWSFLFTEPSPYQIYSIVNPEDRPDLMYFSTRYNIYRSTDWGGHWEKAFSGGGYCDFGPVKVPPGQGCTVNVYAQSNYGYLHSTDCGVSWTFRPNLPEYMVFDQVDPDILYDYIYVNLCKSTDEGLTWTLLGVSASNGFAQSRSSPEIMYAFPYENNKILRSTDHGVSWDTRIMDARYNFSKIKVDPYNPDVLYAIKRIGTGFYRSIDRGIHWKLIGHGLNDHGITGSEFTEFWIHRPTFGDPLQVFGQLSRSSLQSIILTPPGDLNTDSRFTDEDVISMGNYLCDNFIISSAWLDPDANGDKQTNVVDRLLVHLKANGCMSHTLRN